MNGGRELLIYTTWQLAVTANQESGKKTGLI
jgi:hypothetical protein